MIDKNNDALDLNDHLPVQVNPHDGFPISMSPLAWARVCRLGDSYDYEGRGMAPIMDNELDLVMEICGDRRLELFAGDTGLAVNERLDW